MKNILLWRKKKKECYPFSFSILGVRDSTRALQSSPFQNPGGGGLSVTEEEEEEEKKEILVSNIGLLTDECNLLSVECLVIDTVVLQELSAQKPVAGVLD